MRELLAHDGDGGAESGQHGDGEGGSDGQAIDEIVKSVTERDHPRQRLHARQPNTAAPRWHRLHRQGKERQRKILTHTSGFIF